MVSRVVFTDPASNRRESLFSHRPSRASPSVSRDSRVSLGNVTWALLAPQSPNLPTKTFKNWEWVANLDFAVEVQLFQSGSV
jgi:hypothetical protein